MNNQILPGDIIQLAETNGWESIRKQDAHIDGYAETFSTPNNVEIGVEDRTEVGGSTSTHVLIESPVLKVPRGDYTVAYPFFKHFDDQHPHIDFNIAYVTQNWGNYYIKDPVGTPPTPDVVAEREPPDTLFMYVFLSWKPTGEVKLQRLVDTVTALDSLFEHMDETWDVLY